MSGSTSILDSLATAPPTAGMAAGGAPPPPPAATSATAPPTFQAPGMVPPHPAPDNSGATTNLSDADYFAMSSGKMPPAKQVKSSNTSTLDSLAPVPPTPGMVSSGGGPGGDETWADWGQRYWVGIRQGLASSDAMFNAGLGGQGITTPPPQSPPATTFGQRLAGTLGQFTSILPTAAFGAESLPAAGLQILKQVIPTVAAGVGSQIAQDVAPGEAKPYAALGGALLGGGVGGLAQEGTIGLAQGGSSVAGRFGIGTKQNIGGVNVTGTQAANAAGQVRGALGPAGEAAITDPNATYETVAGSMPTTAQVRPTAAAMALEKAHRVASDEPFIARDQAQNNARVAAIEGMQPTGTPAAFGESLVQQLEAAQNQAAAQSKAAEGQVQAATGRLGGELPTEKYGEQIAGAIGAAKAPETAAERQLWESVDPDGTWALPSGSLPKVAQSLLGSISPTGKTDATELAILQRAAAMQGVVRFRDLGEIRKDINQATAGLSGTFGMDPNIRRLRILKDTIDQTIADGAENRMQGEAAAVQSGQMSPGDTLAAKLGALDAQSAARGTEVPQQVPAGGPTGATGAGRAGSAAGAGAGSASATGNSALATAASDARGPAKPESLVDFLIAKGGIQPTGELNDMNAELVHHRQGGRLINPKGLSPDYAREAAEEEGFLRPGSDINDLYDAIAEEVSGRPVYRPGDQAAGEFWANNRAEPGRNADAEYHARDAAATIADQAGVSLTPKELQQASAAIAGGADPHDAVYSAVRATEEAELDRNAQMLGVGEPGMPAAAQQTEMLAERRSDRLANFSQENANRYTAAIAKTRENKQRFGQGGVGQVMRRGKNYQEFAVPRGEVPSKIFTADTREPEEIRRFVKAVGAQKAGDIATATFANDLRSKGIIREDGTVDAGRYANWMNKRRVALRTVPGVADKFKSAAAAQDSYDGFLANEKAIKDNFEKSAAASFVHDDPLVAVRKAFNSSNPTATFSSLVKAVHGGPGNMGPITAAEAGLRRAVVNYILEKAHSAAPSGATTDFLKAATFRTFVRQNAGALRTLFGGQGMQNLEAVAADLRRQAFKTTATAGSDTVQKALAAQKHGMVKEGFHGTAFALVGEMVGRLAEHAMGGEGMLGDIAGIAAGAGGYLIHAMRQNGIRTTNDLVREAMLHPAVARELLTRVPANGKITPILARRIAASLAVAAAGSVNQQMGPDR